MVIVANDNIKPKHLELCQYSLEHPDWLTQNGVEQFRRDLKQVIATILVVPWIIMHNSVCHIVIKFSQQSFKHNWYLHRSISVEQFSKKELPQRGFY